MHGSKSQQMQQNKQDISDRKLSAGERFMLWFLPLLIVNLQRIIGCTSRRIDIGHENLEQLIRQGKPWIYAIWHTNVLYSPYLNRNQNVAVMISSSKDGEYIARVVRHFGNFAIRGSTSRGGVSALKAMIRHLKKGNAAAVTPDGPRGPAFKVQGGLVTSAQIAGVPIVPFHYECTRQIIAQKSWDNHRIPLPFTTFVVSYGNPIFVAPDLDPDEFEKQRDFIETELIKNMRRSQKMAKSLRGSR